MTQVGWSDYTVCQCCGLLAPSQFMLPWTRRVLCRRLASLEPPVEPAGRSREEWVSGPFRYYYVTHEHQVCDDCFDVLLDGGAFAGAFRHRTKIGFLALAAVVAVIIVCLPVLLPILTSALWLDPAEN
jgi:hypothetical protein